MPAADRTTPKTVQRRVKRPKPKPAPTPAPTQRQVANARSQAQQYASQGVAVEHQAHRLKRVQRKRQQAQKQRQHEARDIKSEADLGRVQKHQERLYRDVPHRGPAPALPPDLERKRKLKVLEARSRKEAKEIEQMSAPVLSALEQTVRPLHGIAAGTRESIRQLKKGESPLSPKSISAVTKAAGRGVANKDKSTFSDVLKDVGVPKALRGPGGFALDVALDPTTLATGGLATGARKTALKAAAKAEKVTPTAARAATTAKEANRAKARAAGGGAEAPTLAQRAADRAAKKAQTKPRGVSVRFAGKEVPGVRRGTAAVGAGVKKVTPKPIRKAAGGSRKVAADFNPGIVPEGMTRIEYDKLRQTTRTARHTISREQHLAETKAHTIQKAIGKKNYAQVLDAIEAGEIKKLPPELHAPAVELRSHFRYTRRLERQAGIPTKQIGGKAPKRVKEEPPMAAPARGATAVATRPVSRARMVTEPKGYVPHVPASHFEEPAGRAVGRGVGVRTIKPSSSYARKERRSLAEIRKETPGKYIEDPGVLYAKRMSEGKQAVARSEMNRALAGMGRSVRQGEEVSLAGHERIYHLVGSNIKELDRKAESAFAEGKLAKKGQYIVLNKQAIDRALKTVVPGGDRSATGHVLDRVQGVWKFAATQPNPGFHIRNFIGDFQNAYLAASGHRLPKNVVQASKTLHALGRQERALHKIDGKAKPLKGGVQTPRYGKLDYDQLATELTRTGALRSGFQARELHDLLKGGREGIGTKAHRFRRWVNNREDLFRAATAIEGLRKGKTFEEAAAYAARHHFDYSDLTEIERKVMRRVMPFYTFSSRNIPLQTKSLITRPGKYAQYEKAREEIAKAFGVDLDKTEQGMPEREQRSAPLVVKIGGKQYSLSLGPSGLPLTDLNEFPTTKNPIKQADEWIDRAMSLVTPAIKTPVELWANMSFFFRDQIEREEGPLAPAPTWVKHIPEKYRKQLGIVPDYVDKRTGKKQWGAPAKVVYALGVLPGPINFANRVLTPSERAGKSTGSKILGYAGVRSTPVDAVSTQIENLYDERAKLEKKMRALNQRGVNAENSNDAYDKLREQDKALTDQIVELRTKRGDKVIPGKKKIKPGFQWPEDKKGGYAWPDKGKSKAEFNWPS